MIDRRTVLSASLAAAGTILAGRASAQARPLRLGVLTDLSGPYRDTGGLTAVACVQQAAQDFAAATGTAPAEVIVADHQNKTDLGISLAREWFDRGGVDAIVEVNQSAIAFAVNDLVREKDKVHLNTGAGSSDLTGKNCSPNMTHWQSDTYSRAHGTAAAVLQTGSDKWYFVTADYAFGHSIRDETAKLVRASGGKVMGDSTYPFPSTTDFSAFLLAAQASGANVIALCNTAGDFINGVKQAQEFRLAANGVRVVGMVSFIGDIHALGLSAAQGLLVAEPFYWDMNERTRAFTSRVVPRTPQNYPNSEHACNYAATLHYLKCAAAVGADRAKASGRAVVDAMKRTPTDDDCFGRNTIREDGRVMFPMHLFEVKKPEDSSRPWDYYRLRASAPADQAFRPLAEGGCSFLRKG